MAITSKYRNNGQVCISQLDFIFTKAKKNFTKTFIEKTKKLKIGDGLGRYKLGANNNKKRLEEIEKLVEKTKKKVEKFYTEVKDQRVLTKVIFMNLL